MTADLERALELATQFAHNSLSPDTIRTYDGFLRQFATWCSSRGVSSLPADPAVVAAYLAYRADGGSDVANAEDVKPHAPLSAMSLQNHLSAISKAHYVAGFPVPSSSPFVRAVLSGVKRTKGTRHTHKDPLHIELLRTVLASIAAPTAREDLLTVVTELGAAGMSATRLRALDCDDVTDGSIQVRGSSIPLDLSTAVFAAAHRLAGDRSGQLLVKENDAPFTRAGLDRLLVCASGPEPTRAIQLTRLRDSALLLTMFSAALRRSSVALLRWGDLTELETGALRLRLRRSKTDQVYNGRDLLIPLGTNPTTCPVTALANWRAAVAHQLEVEAVELDNLPVFTAIDRTGLLSATPLTSDAINRVVKARCTRAGIAGDFSSHSLRAGFVTTSTTNGVALEAIAEQTGHASIDILRGYIRRPMGGLTGPLSRLSL
jgi:site-specific recombinase XerD